MIESNNPSRKNKPAVLIMSKKTSNEASPNWKGNIEHKAPKGLVLNKITIASLQQQASSNSMGRENLVPRKTPNMTKSITLNRQPRMEGHQTGPYNALNLMSQLRGRPLLIMEAPVIVLPLDEIHHSMKHQIIRHLPRTLATSSRSSPKHSRIPSTPRPIKFH